MLGTAPEVISGYFDADARHDVDAVVARGELDQATAHRALTLPVAKPQAPAGARPGMRSLMRASTASSEMP